MHHDQNFTSVMPAMLLNKGNRATFVTDGPINEGDTYFHPAWGAKFGGEYESRKLFIGKIIEQRPAKGDWSGDLHKGKTPIFTEAHFK